MMKIRLRGEVKYGYPTSPEIYELHYTPELQFDYYIDVHVMFSMSLQCTVIQSTMSWLKNYFNALSANTDDVVN